MKFRDMLSSDRMADEKLAEGIANFSKAIEQLEIQLHKRLSLIESESKCA